MFVLSAAVKFRLDNALLISGHLGLNVKVTNKSGNPTLLQIAIQSKYS